MFIFVQNKENTLYCMAECTLLVQQYSYVIIYITYPTNNLYTLIKKKISLTHTFDFVNLPSRHLCQDMCDNLLDIWPNSMSACIAQRIYGERIFKLKTRSKIQMCRRCLSGRLRNKYVRCVPLKILLSNNPVIQQL